MKAGLRPIRVRPDAKAKWRPIFMLFSRRTSIVPDREGPESVQ